MKNLCRKEGCQDGRHLCTPRLTTSPAVFGVDEPRARLFISCEDAAKIDRHNEWTVTDLDSEVVYSLRSIDCSLVNCRCDAAVVVVEA